MNLVNRVELNPRVCNGKPVIRGTRIPVSVILEQIAEGESWDTLLDGYPAFIAPPHIDCRLLSCFTRS
jgi:uncharacterized protein (DUF433 family)